MRVENNHAHAYSRFSTLKWIDYFNLFGDLIKTKIRNYKSLNIHLPLEIQHNEILNIKKAKKFINYGEFLKKFFRIKLYWENAPLLKYGTWDLRYSQTNWKNIPRNIDLCLDTGHLMLGSKNKKNFLSKLNLILKEREKQIKHLHLHENDFRSDKHIPVPGKIIDEKLFNRLIKDRTYIVEKGE